MVSVLYPRTNTSTYQEYNRWHEESAKKKRNTVNIAHGCCLLCILVLRINLYVLHHQMCPHLNLSRSALSHQMEYPTPRRFVCLRRFVFVGAGQQP